MIRKIGPIVGLGFVLVLLLSLFSGLKDYFQAPPEPTAEHEFHREPKDVHLASNGPLGHYDRQQLQRGFQVYKEVCAACHGLSLVAFRDLAALGYEEPEIKAIANQWAIEVPSINTETGEAMQHSGIHRIEHVDEDKFVKLFTQNIKLFFDLTAPSQKILQCVIATLQNHPNADGISLPWFTVDDFSQQHDLKISKSSFHRGLKEMLQKGFIAESELPHFYWINPHLFFNGNRMVFITEYRKTEKSKSVSKVHDQSSFEKQIKENQ